MLLPGVASAAQNTDRAVLDPAEAPLGFSLSHMAQRTAVFSASGNAPAHYPDTPFVVLHVSGEDRHLDPTPDGGLALGGTSQFAVDESTPVYVPIFSVDDSPPVLGSFPDDEASALDYFFSPTQVGCAFELLVDGELYDSSALVPYLAGPVGTQPLPDGGGTHMLSLGVFLAPLGRGEHIIEIRGSASGDAVRRTGIGYMSEDFFYVVNVTPGG
jgi:hypothetical protein